MERKYEAVEVGKGMFNAIFKHRQNGDRNDVKGENMDESGSG